MLRGIEEDAEKGGEASFLTRHGVGRARSGGVISPPHSLFPLSLSVSLSFSVVRTEPVGDCRVAINAVELTPGCPFAGEVRLKERRNGRQLPPQRVNMEAARGRRHEHVYNASRLRSSFYFAARFAFRLASRGPPRRAGRRGR